MTEPGANAVMEDISTTISPMRTSLVFVFMLSVYSKYAYCIINPGEGARGRFEKVRRRAGSRPGHVKSDPERGPDRDVHRTAVALPGIPRGEAEPRSGRYAGYAKNS